jgi:hypothetical protein
MLKEIVEENKEFRLLTEEIEGVEQSFSIKRVSSGYIVARKLKNISKK